MQVYEESVTKVETMKRLINKCTKNVWESLTPKQIWHYTVHQRS